MTHDAAAVNQRAAAISDALRLALRGLGLMVGVVIGWQFGSLLGRLGSENDSNEASFAIALGIGTIGYLLGPRWSRHLIENIRTAVKDASVADLLAIAIGLAFGGLVSALVAVPLAQLPPPHGAVLPIFAAVVLIALAITVTLLRKTDLIVPLIPSRWSPTTGSTGIPAATYRRSDQTPAPALLDTSVVIDGRIADVIRTGFLADRLILPRFVLAELQHIADSDDPLRRARGRRGLETLNRIRELLADRDAEVEILDADFDGAEPREVDAKLIRLAKERDFRILTNDFNLERVAQLQGISILNLHELAGALRSPVLPGEDLQLRLVQEGREAGQGVGFLDDGTMVVVDGGKPWVGRQTNVTVIRLLQTGAGRMIFAVPKNAATPA